MKIRFTVIEKATKKIVEQTEFVPDKDFDLYSYVRGVRDVNMNRWGYKKTFSYKESFNMALMRFETPDHICMWVIKGI